MGGGERLGMLSQYYKMKSECDYILLSHFYAVIIMLLMLCSYVCTPVSVHMFGIDVMCYPLVISN